MGVIRRGILGGFSGKVANIIGASWKGIAYMRSQPLSVANPNTAGQQAQRTSMKTLVQWCTFFLASIIKPLNDRFAEGMSGFNLFVQRNIQYVDGSGVIDYSRITISKGNLTAFSGFNVTAAGGADTCTAVWNDNSGTGSAVGTDLNYLLVYNIDQNVFYTGDTVLRSDMSNVITCTGLVAGNSLAVYSSFIAENGSRVCDSVYMGIVAGA